MAIYLEATMATIASTSLIEVTPASEVKSICAKQPLSPMF